MTEHMRQLQGDPTENLGDEDARFPIILCAYPVIFIVNALSYFYDIMVHKSNGHHEETISPDKK